MANLDRTRVRAPGGVELEDRRSQPDEKWAIAISYVAAVAQPIIGVAQGAARKRSFLQKSRGDSVPEVRALAARRARFSFWGSS